MNLIQNNTNSNSTKCYRIKATEKFQDDLSRVKFSDLSYNLMLSGFYTKTDFSEIVILPVQDQMKALIKVIEEQLDQLTGTKQDELWESFLRSLHVDYPSLAFNIAIACDKKGHKEKHAVAGKLRKLDIGAPTNFRHIFSATGSDKAEISYSRMPSMEEDESNSEGTKTKSQSPTGTPIEPKRRASVASIATGMSRSMPIPVAIPHPPVPVPISEL